MKTRYTPLAFAACFFAMSATHAQPKPPLPGMSPTQTAKVAVAAPAVAATGKLNPIGDGATVMSADGKLIWMRCSIGQRFEAGKCMGDPKKVDQRDASNEIKRMNLSGGLANSKQWRLPSVQELHTIVFCDQGFSDRKHTVKLAANQSTTLPAACLGSNYLRPTIDPIIFPNSGKEWVWSDTPDVDKVVNMWAIDFASGSPAPIGRHNTQTSVRAVRFAQ